MIGFESFEVDAKDYAWVGLENNPDFYAHKGDIPLSYECADKIKEECVDNQLTQMQSKDKALDKSLNS